jgi:hypothetical protein
MAAAGEPVRRCPRFFSYSRNHRANAPLLLCFPCCCVSLAAVFPRAAGEKPLCVWASPKHVLILRAGKCRSILGGRTSRPPPSPLPWQESPRMSFLHEQESRPLWPASVSFLRKQESRTRLSPGGRGRPGVSQAGGGGPQCLSRPLFPLSVSAQGKEKNGDTPLGGIITPFCPSRTRSGWHRPRMLLWPRMVPFIVGSRAAWSNRGVWRQPGATWRVF